jgi:phosphatidylglycerophosphate synthase
VSLTADALSGSRVVAALAFPPALMAGGWWPLGLVAIAMATDLTDGRVARRTGRVTGHGAALDSGADIAFVLGGTATGAWVGRLPWVIPASIAASAGAYAIASLRRSAERGVPELAWSRLGHAAGVLNYAVVALLAATVAPAPLVPDGVLTLAGGAAIALNLAAALARPVLRRARGLRAAGRAARSGCSSA